MDLIDLHKTQGRAELYLDLAGVIIVALNNEGIITLMNKKGYKILEYDEGELIGINWFETCVPTYLREQVYDVFKSLMRGEIEPVEFYENPILTKNKKLKMIAWHNTLLYDDEGNIIPQDLDIDDLVERFKQLDYSISKETVRQDSIGKKELIYLYEKKFN